MQVYDKYSRVIWIYFVTININKTHSIRRKSYFSSLYSIKKSWTLLNGWNNFQLWKISSCCFILWRVCICSLYLCDYDCVAVVVWELETELFLNNPSEIWLLDERIFWDCWNCHYLVLLQMIYDNTSSPPPVINHHSIKLGNLGHNAEFRKIFIRINQKKYSIIPEP